MHSPPAGGSFSRDDRAAPVKAAGITLFLRTTFLLPAVIERSCPGGVTHNPAYMEARYTAP